MCNLSIHPPLFHLGYVFLLEFGCCTFRQTSWLPVPLVGMLSVGQQNGATLTEAQCELALDTRGQHTVSSLLRSPGLDPEISESYEPTADDPSG